MEDHSTTVIVGMMEEKNEDMNRKQRAFLKLIEFAHGFLGLMQHIFEFKQTFKFLFLCLKFFWETLTTFQP